MTAMSALESTAVTTRSKAFNHLFEANEATSQFINSVQHLFCTDYIAITQLFIDEINGDSHGKSISPKNRFNELETSTVFRSTQTFPQTFLDLRHSGSPLHMASHDYQECFHLPITDYFELYCIPFSNEKGELQGILAIKTTQIEDVSGKHPALNVLLQAMFEQAHKFYEKERLINTYQTVMDLMPQRVFWRNTKSIYLGCNQAFANDASIKTPLEIRGKTDHDIFPDEAELYRSDDARTMLTREHMINSEEPQTHSCGNTIWLRTSKRPIIDRHDNVIGVVGTYDDITELKHTQCELEDAKLKLEERVEAHTKELENLLGVSGKNSPK